VNNNISATNINFTSRCPQILDAQWVCRKVKSIPHLSPSHTCVSVKNYVDKNQYMYYALTNGKPAFSSKEIQMLRIIKWQQKVVDKINIARNFWRYGCKSDVKLIDSIINQFKYDKLGNCGEEAFMSAAILKMNGVKDPCVARLTVDGNLIDHSICVFNKDGSKFDGHYNKKTIIVDPWVGDADFATNMFVKYKNIYKDYIDKHLQPKSEINIKNPRHLDISDEEKFALILKYNDLRYPATIRDFMKSNRAKDNKKFYFN